MRRAHQISGTAKWRNVSVGLDIAGQSLLGKDSFHGDNARRVMKHEHRIRDGA
jgi:hypothetical protein